MAVLALNTGLIPLAARAATRRTATKRVVAPKVRPRRDATRRPRAIATHDAGRRSTATTRDERANDGDDARRRGSIARARRRADRRASSRRRRAVGRTRASRNDRSIGAVDGAYLCARDSRSIVDNRMGKQ
jgi:hypothetical protein